MNKASFFSRFIAWLVDGFAMAVIAILLSLLLSGLTGVARGTDSFLLSAAAGTLGVMVWFAILILQFLYFGYYWNKSGQSIGMKLTGIKVIRQDGNLMSYIRAALRGTFGYWVSGLIFGLGYIWAAFDGEKEAWHDKIFDTWVIEAK
ncbi:MAG: RDD family protein [Anaerolineaceae bacterium]|nr:MAG: RDD family protein [Anaerolineaceae bacterium]